MWLHGFTHYLLKHQYRALLLTFFSAFIPIVSVLSILIAALVTLVRGAREGAIYTFAASLPFLLGYFYHHHDIPLVYWVGIGVAVTSNVLTWVFAVLLLRKTNWSVLLQIAALLGVLIISIIHLIIPNIADWWGQQLQFYYEHTRSIAHLINASNLKMNDVQIETIQLTKQYATGLMIAAILLNGLWPLMLAQYWQSVVFVSKTEKKALHFIRLSQLAGVLFILSLWLSYLSNSVVLDMMPILYLLFTVAGLSLIHYFFSFMKSSTKWFWLLFFYVSLFFTIPMSMMVMSMLALFDSWVDIRKRLLPAK